MLAKISLFLFPCACKNAWRRLTNSSTGSRYQPMTSATTRADSPADSPVDAATLLIRSGSTPPYCDADRANAKFLPESGQIIDDRRLDSDGYVGWILSP